MFILESQATIEKAIERAKAVRPRVRVRTFGEYSVSGSAGNTYTVRCERRDGQKVVDRDIPMNSEVRSTLADLCKGKGSDDLVFASPRTGGVLTRVKRSFQSACHLAGIEGLWWHDLRATFGTRLATAGHNAFEIAQLMGHSDVRMTMRYVRFIEQSKRSAVESAKLSFQKSGHILATQEKQPLKRTAVSN